ncbi:unnamed protein product [Clonostachys rosea f. rosea IK726]|uniref:Uncharacterized protein n=1 Tax=Clonostachys rosea f. rosea IK726 TaxID=1349383 RepID=A0ACA9UEX9_BIOOC|nr:unnamed protein product [Clonostachys rosea f. rosea IK726]
MMTPLVSKQPFHAIYIVLFAFKSLARLPWLIMRYGIKSSRPYPEWSLATCIVTAMTREIFRYQTATLSNGVASVESSQTKAKERFRKVQPGPASLYTGPLAPGVTKPAAVGGLWYPEPPTDGASDERVVLHFIGGAFVLALNTDSNGADVATSMSKHMQASRTFVAQYRVTTSSDSRFPAALQDIITFYSYILETGVKPSNVIVGGDSAGGNLVLGLLRYLETYPVLPKPGGAMAWSPWVNVTKTAGEDYYKSSNSKHDLLYGPLLHWGADAYYPEEATLSDDEVAYISPLHRPFKTTVPLWLHSGMAESFHDDIKEFADEMTAVEGNSIKLCSTKAAPHDILLAHKPCGFTEQLGVAVDDASPFF